MDIPFKMNYKPRHADVMAMVTFAAPYLLTQRKSAGFWLFFVLLISLIFFLIHFLFDDRAQNYLSQYLGASAAVWIPLVFLFFGVSFVTRQLGAWKQKRCIEQLEVSAPIPAVSLTLDDKQFNWAMEHSESWVSYGAIRRIFVCPIGIGLIYDGSVVAIPRDAIGGDAAFLELLKFLLGKVDEDARTLSLQDKFIQQLLSIKRPVGNRAGPWGH
jgi:hypothetical protein